MDLLYNFSSVEPDTLKKLKINYETIDFIRAQFYQNDTVSKDSQLLFKSSFWVIENFLIIRKEAIDTNLQIQVHYQYLDIEMWLVKFTDLDQANPTQDLFIKLTASDSQTHELAIQVLNEIDYINSKPLFSAICTIQYPPIDKEYSIKRKLGSGAQASVNLYLSKNVENPEYFAVKIYKFKEKTNYSNIHPQIKSEIHFLRKLKICSNITQLERVYFDEKRIYLVMNYAKHGTLMKYVEEQRRFTEEQIRSIMEQLILAVDLMHKNEILHRDIKPDNILIDDIQALKICVSDLGLAFNKYDFNQAKIKCGTPGYVAPEVLKGSHIFTEKADVFSMGCIFYKLITQKNLFLGNNFKDVLLSNKFQSPLSAINVHVNGVSNECKELLTQMLQQNPDTRPSTEQCLNHNWFSIDRFALQNLLFINKNTKILATLIMNNKTPETTQEDFKSFQIAPNFFEHIYSNISHLSNNSMLSVKESLRSQTPKIGAQRRLNSQQMRICYNNIISSGRQMSSESKNNIINSKEESKVVQNDNLFIQSRQQQLEKNSSSNLLKEQAKEIELKINRIFKQNSGQIGAAGSRNSNMERSPTDSVVENLAQLTQEYSPRSRNQNISISQKYTNRTFICDAFRSEKSMNSINKTQPVGKRIFK